MEEGKGRFNIIGIAWTEDRYGWASAFRLRSMVRHFHPDVKVVHANPDLESDFKPLVEVPAKFIFDKTASLSMGIAPAPLCTPVV